MLSRMCRQTSGVLTVAPVVAGVSATPQPEHDLQALAPAPPDTPSDVVATWADDLAQVERFDGEIGMLAGSKRAPSR